MLHRLSQVLHSRILASSDLFRRTPLEMLFVDPQYGHLNGRPLGMMITSRLGEDANLYKGFVPPCEFTFEKVRRLLGLYKPQEVHMKGFNKVILMGNLASEVSMNTLPSGTKVAEFRLAVNERFKNKEGKEVEQTVFVTVESWGAQAENCYKYLRKGRAVLVEGRLKMNEWETDPGKKRSRLLITAEQVQFLDKPAETK